MAKNKQRGKKIQNVFQIANKQSKPKTKAKPVKSSLKHINTLKNEKVESLNQMFTEVQRDTRSLSKTTLNEDKVAPKMVREAPKEAVNVDGAAQLFSQL